MLKSLDIFLWDMKVGTIISTKKKYTEEYLFYFDPEFVKRGYDIAPLRGSITGLAAQNGLPIFPESGKLFAGLPSFIADSLPDHWGHTVFRGWATQHNISMKQITPLDLLAYVGRRGMGALEFLPPASDHFESPFKVEIKELSHLASQVMDEARGFHTRLGGDFAIESLFKVGTSAGGRRPKAVININPETKECYSGQVNAPEPGYVPMIIKFDEHLNLPTTRIEYSYYLMAKEAGLKMMPSMLFETGSECHFLTERFDRDGDMKLHMQTLAAMAPDSDCYEDLFKTAVSIGIPPSEIRMLFLQMIMNIVCGNVDDHNKNFSFIMSMDGVWHTSPAYDFTFTVDPNAPAYMNRHSMTINGKVENISYEDFLSIADELAIKESESIIKDAIAIAIRYREFGTKAGVGEKWISLIEKEIKSRINDLES